MLFVRLGDNDAGQRIGLTAFMASVALALILLPPTLWSGSSVVSLPAELPFPTGLLPFTVRLSLIRLPAPSAPPPLSSKSLRFLPSSLFIVGVSAVPLSIAGVLSSAAARGVLLVLLVAGVVAGIVPLVALMGLVESPAVRMWVL